MTDIYRIALLSLNHSVYLSTNDAPVVTTSANKWGRVQVAACRASSPDLNWLARVSPRAVAARPNAVSLAGHRALEAANDVAWRVVA